MRRDITELAKVHNDNHAERLRVIAMWRRAWWLTWIPGVSDLIDLCEAQEELLESRWMLVEALNS